MYTPPSCSAHMEYGTPRLEPGEHRPPRPLCLSLPVPYPPQLLNMPALSPTMSKGNIVEWKKKVGRRAAGGWLAWQHHGVLVTPTGRHAGRAKEGNRSIGWWRPGGAQGEAGCPPVARQQQQEQQAWTT